MIHRTDHFRILIHCIRNILPDGLSGHGHALRVQQSDVRQFFHYRIDAARLVEIFHISRSCRCQVAQVRCLLADRIGKCNIKIKSHFMGDCRKMEHAVRRTAERHIHGQRIQDGFLRHNITRADIFAVHFHHRHTRMLGELDALRIDCRDRAVSAKSHSQRLGETVHGVRRVHSRTGAAGRTNLLLVFLDFLLRHRAGCIGTYRLKHGREAALFALYMSGKHRSA